MRVFFIQRKFLLLIGLGVMIGLGFWSVHISDLQTVLTPQQKEVAIVIDDFGGRADGIKEMMALPYALTFAVMPFEEFSYQQAEQAVNKGYEIIIHMPFEAVSADPRWYGTKYISAHSSPAEIKSIIDDAFSILPMAVGLSNHMGSKATADSQVMAEVFKELEKKKCFYFDSRTTSLASSALTIATDLNLPYATRDVFLDNTNSASSMQRQLDELMELARAKGIAVGIGHVGQTGTTLAALLHTKLPKYEKEGFHFVPLSKLIYSRVSAKPHKQKDVVIGIDPGHGGIDSGTRSGSLLEKDLNLKFSKRLADALKTKGYQVVLTRDRDQLLTPYTHYTYKNRPYKRDDFRCRIQKIETAKATALVSIHANWSHLSYHRGPIVYYSTLSPASQKIAQHVQEHLNQVQPYRKLPKLGHHYFLEHAEIPAILVELGFFSNPEDQMLLQDDNYLERLKSVIVNGLTESL